MDFTLGGIAGCGVCVSSVDSSSDSLALLPPPPDAAATNGGSGTVRQHMYKSLY